jgi:hypothetical protein
MATSSVCACGKPGAKMLCGKCKLQRYCGRECQVAHHKLHKKTCQPPSAMDTAIDAVFKKALKNDADTSHAIREFLPCMRCQQGCTQNTRCRIAHPTHLRQDCGGMSAMGGMTSNFYCGACNQSYSETVPFNGPRDAVKIVGAKWCFDGAHTLTALPESDRRRVFKGLVSLKVGPHLQEEIDALPADVETLTIVSSGFYDDSDRFVLDKVRDHLTLKGFCVCSLSLSLTSLSACPRQALPKLRELQLIDVCMSKLRLVRETTPRLECLTLQNVPEHCDMELELPELQTVDVRFWSGRPQAMETMLAAATKVGRRWCSPTPPSRPLFTPH